MGWKHTAATYIFKEDACTVSPFVDTAPEVRSPAPSFVSSQGTNLEDSLKTASEFSQRNFWEQSEKLEKVYLLICAIYLRDSSMEYI